jgi:hypothetical protein
VQVGKTADFATAANLAATIERRILEAFLVMNIRNAERVTAEEVRLTQLELEQSLGGLFSLLTVEFLVPYLNRTLLILQRTNQIPRLPKDVVRPKIVAGINSLGRGQDNESLLNLVRTAEQLEQLKEQSQQEMTTKSLVDQAGQLAGTPILDPSRNPDLADQAAAVLGNLQPPEE